MILNSLVYNENYCRIALPHIKSAYFQNMGEQHVFGMIDSFVNEFGTQPTPEALAAILERTNLAEGIYNDALSVISEMEPQSENVDWLLKESEAWALDNSLANAVRRANRVYQGEDELTRDQLPDLFAEANDVKFQEDLGHFYWEQAAEHFDLQHSEQVKLPFKVKILNQITRGGVSPKTLNVVLAGINTGKAQPLYSNIITPDGVKKMGDITVGDRVVVRDGSSAVVTGVYPQGVKSVYEITLADGRKTRACGEHLWNVHKGSINEPAKTVDTAEVIRLLGLKKYDQNGTNKLYLDMPHAVQYGDDVDIELPIDPYLLGVLLGDGCLSGQGSPMFSTPDEHIVNRVRELVGLYGCDVNYAGSYDYRIVCNGKRNNPVKDILVDLGLWGHKAQSKFIPEKYLKGSIKQRLELVRGLMDTDGYADKNGCMEFYTTSVELSNGMVQLIRSLGGYDKVKVTESWFDGKRYSDCFHNSIKMRPETELFTLPRKLERANKRSKGVEGIAIKSIELVDETECQCIMVDHPEHLYLVDDFVVTHNTTFLIDRACEQCELGKNVLYITCEVEERVIRHRSDVRMLDVDFDRLERMTKNEYLAYIAKKRRSTSGEFVIKEYPSGTCTASMIRQYIKSVEQRKGIKFDIICVDYLTEMASGRLPVHMMSNTNVYFGSVARELRALAFEFNVPVWTAMQLTRDKQDGLNAKVSDTADAITIPKIADFMLSIGMEEVDGMLKQAYVTQMKNRYDDKAKLPHFRIGLDNSRQLFFDLGYEQQEGVMSESQIKYLKGRDKVIAGANPETLKEKDSVENWSFGE